MRWLVIAVGCAACGRGFFDPSPGFHDAPGSGSPDALGPPIAYIQSGAAASAVNYLDLPPPLTQRAGNTNIVIVSWSGGAISSLADNTGNSYATAIGPITGANNVTLSIFYATNINAGTNNVHIEFPTMPLGLGGVIIEYANVDPAHPIDNAVGATGSATAAASGELHLTSDGDLEVAAVTSDSAITSQLPGFTVRSQADGILVEDTPCPTAGTYAAITSDALPGNWVDEAIGLRRAP